MKIALVYDLRDDYIAAGYSEDAAAEFDRIDTIEAIEQALAQLHHQPQRVGNIRALVQRLARGERWDLVFNIAEGLHGIAREAQVPALLDAYEIPYVFSDPLVCALTLHKGMTKRVLRDLGLPTPEFAIINTLADVEAVQLDYPLFAKPLAEGTSKGIGADAKVSDPGALLKLCDRLLKKYQQPVLVERYLPGQEVTVGVVGTGADARVVGVLDVVLLDSAEPEIYTFANKEECETRVRYDLLTGPFATEAAQLALAAWRGVGCRDGGRVDLRANAAGQPEILEINPLPGMHPSHSDLPIMCQQGGWRYVDLVSAIVSSALERTATPACAATCVA